MVRLTERDVSEAKVVYADKITHVDEHDIHAAFSARAVKFAKKVGLGHGKNVYPWFDNV